MRLPWTALVACVCGSVQARAQLPVEEVVGPMLITSTRIAALPRAVRNQWRTYMIRSERLHTTDTAAMRAELRGLGTSSMAKAPYSAPDFRYGERPARWFASDSALRLTESVLTWQTRSGGWSKRTDMWRPREAGMSFYSETETWHYAPTFDNGATTGQLRFLAEMTSATGMPSFAKAFTRGLELLLSAQQPNGCWPQSYPLEGGYHDAATFNDDVTILALRLLDDVAAARWQFIDDVTSARARRAQRAGVSCLLRAQAIVKGKRTIWGQQHDRITLAIVPARRYELAGLAGRESASIMTYLMSLPRPSADVVRAVNAAAMWFKANAMKGYRYDGYDLVPDQTAGPLWPRLTEVATGRPIFANRDGVKLYEWDKLTDRRSGYGWFGTEPAAALVQYQQWSRSHGHLK